MFSSAFRVSFKFSVKNVFPGIRNIFRPVTDHPSDPAGVKTHKFRCLYPWKTRADLANYLHETIVYNSDEIIALNKPYGIGIHHPKPKEKAIVETLTSAGQDECEFYISDVLPLLQSRLGLTELHIIKSPERYSSGVMLLTPDSNVGAKVSKSIERSKAKIFPPYVHWAVVTGIPTSDNKKSRVGLSFIDLPESSQKAPVIVPVLSKNVRKKRDVIPATVEMKISSSNYKLNCALIEISTTTMRHHFLRVYSTYRLAPILGDSLFSSRVKTVLGKLVAVSPNNAASYSPSTLSPNLCKALQLSNDSIGLVPNHLHLHQITLTGFNKGTDVVISALPQNHFLWSLKQLSLQHETLKQVEKVTVSSS